MIMSYKAIQSSLKVLKQKTFTGEAKQSVLTYNEYEKIKDLDYLPDNIAPNILLVPGREPFDIWDPTYSE